MKKTPLSDLKPSLPPAVAGERTMVLRAGKISGQAGGQDREPPSRLVVAPWGETDTRQGKIVVDARTLAMLPGRQAAARFDRVIIDKAHKTAFKENEAIDPTDILAYGTPEVVEGEGVILSAIRWTPEGQRHWAQYEDLSPAIRQQKESGVVTFLDSVALVARGEVERLTMFSAAGIYLQPTEQVMNELLLQYMRNAGVTVPDDATEEQIRDLAAQDLAKKKGSGEGTEDPAALGAAKIKPDPTAEETARRLSALEATETKRQKEEIKRQASASGKVIPLTDTEIDEMPVKLFAGMVEKLPAGVVPMDRQSATTTTAAAKTIEEKKAALSADEKKIAATMGVSEEDFVKYGG